MLSIFRKEINLFFSSLIGYIVIGVFLVVLGLFLFVFPDTSILNFGFASLDPLFSMAPNIFVFLIPAITMRTFAEEQQSGTIELLITRPISDWQIILGKYLASFVLVAFALLPTLLYYYTVYDLGAPQGNLDSGGIMGSYVGLLFLAAGLWPSVFLPVLLHRTRLWLSWPLRRFAFGSTGVSTISAGYRFLWVKETTSSK